MRKIAVANLAARRIHEIGAPFHLGDQRLVEEIFRLRMQRGVDRHHVADGNHGCCVRVEGDIQLLFKLCQCHVRLFHLGLQFFQLLFHKNRQAG